MGHLIGIDVGTTAVKAGAFREDGVLLAVATEEYALSTPGADRAELDGSTYWAATIAATRRAIASAGVRAHDVAAIAVSSQGETVTPVDPAGTPIAPSLVWLDNRASVEAGELQARFDPLTIYRATGVPAVNATFTASKLLWWRRHEPDTFSRAARFLLVEDLILHRLTGRFVSEGGVQCTSLLYDIRSGNWWQPMLDVIGVGAERLPELCGPGDIVGSLSRDAADALGLPTSVAVIAGGMDQGAGALGVGNVGPGIISESTGGALTLQAAIDRPDGDPTHQTPVYVHSARGMYLYCPVCPTGGLSLMWFRDHFGEAEVARAASEGRSPFDLLTDLAGTIAPGADGLIMLPHLMGAFSPEYEPRARGVWFGFTLAHGRAHFVRAILEAVAYMLRRNIELLSAAGASAEEIRSHGGGARSELWCQIKADVCDRPVVTLVGADAAIRGNAMLAGLATGAFATLDEACAVMVREQARYAPNPANRETYATGYRRYLDLFEALRPAFAEFGSGT